MIHIFSVYVMDVTEESYSLHVDASDVVEPHVLQRIAKEVSDQLNSVPSEELPEVDAPAKSWNMN